MKNPLIIVIGAIVVVLLIVAGVEHFILNKPSPEETKLPAQQEAPTKETELPAAQPASTEESVSTTIAEQSPLTFEQKIEKLRETIEDVYVSGESREITLVFTEVEANEEAVKLVAQAEVPKDIPLEIKGVHVDFQTDNNVLTEAETIAFGSFPVKIKVKSQVSIVEGEPTVEVTDVNFGFVPLPSSLKDRITDFVEQTIGDLLARFTETELGAKTTLEFTEIDIQEEEVTIRVIIKPRV